MSIDVHNHAITNRVLELVTSDPVYDVKVVDGMWHSRNISSFEVHAAWYDPDAKLREMDKKQLDGAVLSAAPKPLYFYELPLAPQARVAREMNAGLADFCSSHPDRLRWMAHVPLAFPTEAAEILSEASSRGAAGVQVGTSAAGHRLDEPAYEPFWAAVNDLDLPVFIHPAYELQTPDLTDYVLHSVIGLPFETTIALERIICSRLLDRYPRVRLVAAHGGGFFPWSVGRLKNYISLRKSLEAAPPDPWSYVGRIQFDSKVDDIDSLRFLISKAGPENVMIGTDCSFASAPAAPVGDVREALGGEEGPAFQRVVRGNAAALFGFDSEAAN